jgi:hypothetical protein
VNVSDVCGVVASNRLGRCAAGASLVRDSDPDRRARTAFQTLGLGRKRTALRNGVTLIGK